MIKTLTLAVSIAALGTAAAVADSHGGGRLMGFIAEWDMNDDGAVRLDDFQTRRSDQFEMFDLNGDGNIGADEQVNMAETIAVQQEVNHGGDANGQQRGPGQAIHASMTAGYADTNTDGLLSRAEWDAATARLFGELDRNSDGSLDVADFRRGG